MSYHRPYGMGDAAADAAAQAQACALYSADLAKWQSEQQAYIAAMSARAATIASDQASYAAALKKYQSAVASQQAGYARDSAEVFARYKTPIPKGAPVCVPKSAHDTAAHDCYLIKSALHGGALGAFDWTTIPSCLVADLPVCGPVPVKPVALPAPPLPTLRAKPTAPSGCTSTPKVGPAVVPVPITATTAVAPAPAALPILPPSPADLGPIAPAPAEASMTETKSGAGLIVVAALGALTIGYLLFKKKKPAAA